MNFEVEFPDGTIWVDRAANHGAAAASAIRRVLGEKLPDTLTITIRRCPGGAVVVPAPQHSQ